MTPTQCRMARAALSWSIHQLALNAGLNRNTVNNFEKGKPSITTTVAKIKTAFESSGIEFDGENIVSVLKNNNRNADGVLD